MRSEGRRGPYVRLFVAPILRDSNRNRANRAPANVAELLGGTSDEGGLPVPDDSQADLPNALATVPFRNQRVGIKMGDGLLPTP